MTDSVPIHNLCSVGMVADRKPHTLQPEAWSRMLNVRMASDGLERFKGHSAAEASPLFTPQFIMSVPSVLDTAWIYCSSTRAAAFMSGVSTEITRLVSGVPSPYLTINPHDWDSTMLGGVPILNNQAETPQWWPAVSAGTALENLPAWPAGVTAKCLVAFGPYLVAMNIYDSGSKFSSMIWWSHKAEPGTVPSSWDYTDPTVDAARTQLTDVDGGEIVDGVLLGNMLIIYKQFSTHALKFVGGRELFAPELLQTTSGLLTSKCAAAFNKGSQHFVVTSDDVIVHSGTRDATSIVDGVLRKFLFNDMDSTSRLNSFVFDNPAYKEVWFAYPEAGATYPTKAAVWGYGTSNKGWTFREFTGCAAKAGKFSRTQVQPWDTVDGSWKDATDPWSQVPDDRVLFTDNGQNKIYILDDGDTFDGVVPTTYVERTGLAVYGKDRNGSPKVDFSKRKLVLRIWPKLSGGRCYVTIGGQVGEGKELIWGGPLLFTATEQEFVDLDPPINTRLIAVRFELLTAGTQLSGYDIELVVTSNQ